MTNVHRPDCSSRRSAGRWPLFLITAIVAAGCDLTGQYDKKFQDALQAAAKRAVFEGHLHATPTEVMDSSRQPIGVKLRLPRVFDSNSKVMPQISVPGMPALPISNYTLMIDLDDDTGKRLPCMVSIISIAAPKGAGQKVEGMQNMLATTMSAMMPGAKFDKWEDVSLPTPAGETITLKRMRGELSQPLPGAKGAAAAKVDSRMEMYQIDAGNSLVMVSWMTPKPQAQKHNLEKAIEASMGSVEVTPQPASASTDGKAAAPAGKAPSGCG